MFLSQLGFSLVDRTAEPRDLPLIALI